MEKDEYCVDCLVVLDGKNPSFFSYMDYEQAQFLQEVGLSNAEAIILKETNDRQIPRSLTKGISMITDVLVRLEPNICINLN